MSWYLLTYSKNIYSSVFLLTMLDPKAKTNNYYAKPAKHRNDMSSVLSSFNKPCLRYGAEDNKKIPSLINGKQTKYRGVYVNHN